MEIVAALLALAGHGAFWIGVVNRLHALGWPRSCVKSLALAAYLACAALPAAFALHVYYRAGLTDPSGGWFWDASPFWRAYAVACWCILAITVVRGVWLQMTRANGQRLRDERARALLPAGPPRSQSVAGLRARCFARVPGNQIVAPQLVERTLVIAGLPAALRGTTLLHLSDLHFSGRIATDHFRRVVAAAAQAPADLVVLTGDLCDRAELIDEVASVLAPLRGRVGQYFILGNHDLRTRQVPRLRAAMTAAGWHDLGQQPILLDVHGARVLLAGDERPWFAPLAGWHESLGRGLAACDLAILAAHTPDRVTWARRRGFHLVLAGHTHGGQVCLPVVGPVLCPSWHGVRFAAGVFHLPPTLLHVSRGTASLFPLRWWCPPEVVRITLV